jgi:putative transposase
MTVRRSGSRLLVTLSVDVSRHSRNHQPSDPTSTVGVDAGVRTLATISGPEGQDVTKVDNPAPLEAALKDLRRLCRTRSRRRKGSRRYREVNAEISELHARIARIRRHHIHVLTTRLAKTHGRIVIEDLSVAGILAQKGAYGARTRRRRAADAAMAEIARQLGYKTQWYGSELVVADRWYPSSKTCFDCGHVQDIGWVEQWTCHECGAVHDRDINAAVNLARLGDLGSVGAPVKRGADHQTGPRPAGGEDTRKPTKVGNSKRSAAA